jgi:hypothetical protein
MSEYMAEQMRIARENGFPGMIIADSLVMPHLHIEVKGDHDITMLILGWMLGKAQGSASAFDLMAKTFGSVK